MPLESIGTTTEVGRRTVADAHRSGSRASHGRSSTASTKASSTTSPRASRAIVTGYYQIPFGLHWSEVTASFASWKSAMTAPCSPARGLIERSAYCIHAPIHRLVPHGDTVLHTHMPFGSALLARLEDQSILP